jgi:long-subunit acyl-CoA synthetase (AMP-forming)
VNYLGWKENPTNSEYKWLTYGDVNRDARELGSYLLERGLKPGHEQKIGIYARNRPEVY